MGLGAWAQAGLVLEQFSKASVFMLEAGADRASLLWTFETSNSTPSDTPPPTKHLRSLSKELQQLSAKHSNI